MSSHFPLEYSTLRENQGVITLNSPIKGATKVRDRKKAKVPLRLPLMSVKVTIPLITGASKVPL